MAASHASRCVHLVQVIFQNRGTKVLPLFIALPHTALEDGVYDGFFIPKGELISCVNLLPINPHWSY